MRYFNDINSKIIYIPNLYYSNISTETDEESAYSDSDDATSDRDDDSSDAEQEVGRNSDSSIAGSSSDEEHEDDIDQEESASQLIDAILKIVAKVRKIVKFARKASLIRVHIADWAKGEGKQCRTLILDFRIRWNTIYMMLARLIQFREVIEQITSFPDLINGVSQANRMKLKSLSITSNEWNLILTLESLLEPFFNVTKMLSGSNYKTSSIAYVLKNALTSIYTQEKIDTADTKSLLKGFILEKINFYFNKHFDLEGENNILVI